MPRQRPSSQLWAHVSGKPAVSPGPAQQSMCSISPPELIFTEQLGACKNPTSSLQHGEVTRNVWRTLVNYLCYLNQGLSILKISVQLLSAFTFNSLSIQYMRNGYRFCSPSSAQQKVGTGGTVDTDKPQVQM